MRFFFIVYKSFRKVWNRIMHAIDSLFTHVILLGNGVTYSAIITKGIPYVMVSRGAKGITLGKNFAMNNGVKANPIGCYERCTLFVSPNAGITIGDNVGISQAALIAVDSDITIGNNVKIGGGTQLLTSDFHSLDFIKRRSYNDEKERISAPIIIEEDVFIGTHCIVLKGITVGARSVIGAGSVVTQSIPSDEIWGGNPAKFIRKV